MKIKFVFFLLLFCLFHTSTWAQLKVKAGGNIEMGGADALDRSKVNVVNESGQHAYGLNIIHKYTASSNPSFGLRVRVDEAGVGLKQGIVGFVQENDSSIGACRAISGVGNLYGPTKSQTAYLYTRVKSTSMGHKYGLYSEIAPDASGAGTGGRYAIYAKMINTTGASNHYAGYFRGNVHFNGNLSTLSGTVSTSDRRFKTNIRDIQGALASLMQLQPKNYEYKTNILGMSFPTGTQYGLIAQEVETVFPAMVKNLGNSINEDDYEQHELASKERIDAYKALNYQELIPVLIGAVKEQQAIIEELKTRIEVLEQ